MNKEIFISGSVVNGESPIELHKKPVDNVKLKANFEDKTETRQLLDLGHNQFPKRYVDLSLIKAASSTYHISPNFKDYIIVPVPLITSDLPNRNMQAFELQDLVSFYADFGHMRYKTFIGKPTFDNHANTDLTAAKGVNLDVSLIPIKRYNIVKLVVLSAFDRSKDTTLVKNILNRTRNSYSMGAMAPYLECSICGGIQGPAVTRTCNCYNTDYRDILTLGRVVNGRLNYHIAREFRFVENSSVDVPADVTAISDTIL